MNPLADRVRAERLNRGWSIRDAAAATHGQLSNTWWGKFEDGKQPLTDGIRAGVAEAFGWANNWPDESTHVESLDEVLSRLDALEAGLTKADAQLEELARAVRTWVKGAEKLDVARRSGRARPAKRNAQ